MSVRFTKRKAKWYWSLNRCRKMLPWTYRVSSTQISISKSKSRKLTSLVRMWINRRQNRLKVIVWVRVIPRTSIIYHRSWLTTHSSKFPRRIQRLLQDQQPQRFLTSMISTRTKQWKMTRIMLLLYNNASNRIQLNADNHCNEALN